MNGVTANGTALLAFPPTVTMTFTLPAGIVAGTSSVMLVEVQTDATPASVPLNVTLLVPCAEPKFAPVMITGVAMGPAVGERPQIVGPELTVNGKLLLAVPPAVTITNPDVAPAGTFIPMLPELQLPAVPPDIPLKVTVLVPCAEPKFAPVIVTGAPTAPAQGLTL